MPPSQNYINLVFLPGVPPDPEMAALRATSRELFVGNLKVYGKHAGREIHSIPFLPSLDYKDTSRPKRRLPHYLEYGSRTEKMEVWQLLYPDQTSITFSIAPDHIGSANLVYDKLIKRNRSLVVLSEPVGQAEHRS